MIYCDCESTEFINLKNEKYLNEYKFVFKCDYKSKMFFISFWLLLIMNEIFLLIADSAHLGEKKKNIIKKKKTSKKMERMRRNIRRTMLNMLFLPLLLAFVSTH